LREDLQAGNRAAGGGTVRNAAEDGGAARGNGGETMTTRGIRIRNALRRALADADKVKCVSGALASDMHNCICPACRAKTSASKALEAFNFVTT